MKKILFPIIAVTLMTVTLFSGITLAESDSSGYEPVTFESSIEFTAIPQKDGSVEMKWSRYCHSEEFNYYKIVRSQENSDPVYPEDGYIFFDSNIDTLTYTDTDSPVGTSFYRLCQIASPKRYCSQKVWMITKDAAIETPEAAMRENKQESMVSGFTDVPQSHWAASCISRLAENDIIQSGGVAFRPADPVNRAEFLKFVMKAYYPDDTGTEKSGCFNDVRSGQWFSPFVCAAKEKDIVSGYSGNLYRPANRITRAEGVAIVVKALRLPILDGPPVNFTDVVAPWQKSFIYAAVKENVVTGYDENRFGPNDAMSRQQAAKIICNALDNRPKPLEQSQDYSVISKPSTPEQWDTESSESNQPVPVSPVTPALLVPGTPSIRTSAIVIDHLTTDLAKVPAGYVTAAKSLFRIAYGHTSHGSQITTGMEILNGSAGSLYAFNEEGRGGALRYDEGVVYGDLGGDWEPQTRTMLNRAGNDINMVMWSWCGQLSDMSTPEVQDYLTKMNKLENDYSNVTFVYMTGHLDGGGESGTLNRNNETIRKFVRDNRKVLFDFADIESYNPDGAYFLNLGATDGNDYDSGNWATAWCSSHSGSPLCAVNSCAHSTSLNCNVKARAFWWMMARLAGWDGK